MARLGEAGDWTPAILSSQKTFLQLAGVEGKLAPAASPTSPLSGPQAAVGDVFFDGDDMYYLISSSSEPEVRFTERGMYGSVEEPFLGLEIGVMSPAVQGTAEKLNRLAGAIEDAIRGSLDGRKTRHMTFAWESVQTEAVKLKRVLERADENGSLKLTPAALDDGEVMSSEVLTQPDARRLLITLAQSGFGRERDIVSGSRREGIADALSELTKAGLVDQSFLLECKRGGAPLTRIVDKAALENPAVAGLICGVCGSAYKDEILVPGYAVSDLGRTLIRKSHWMNIWLTKVLVSLGVPVESIVWNLAEEGEEVDLIMDFRGQLWIFEMKDREFGAGDAYPFNYRMARYGAFRGVIVTADKVSKDAKRVFEDLSKEAGRTRRPGPLPIFVEGLASARPVLGKELALASLTYARRRLGGLGQFSGHDFGQVLHARYGQDG